MKNFLLVIILLFVNQVNAQNYQISDSDFNVLKGIEDDNPQATFAWQPTSTTNPFTKWDTIANKLYVKSLSFEFNNLSTLNLAGLQNLTELTIQNEIALQDLNLDDLTELNSLVISNTNISSINLISCTKLTNLMIGSSNLQEINLEQQAMLTSLNLEFNELESISLVNNTALEQLVLSFNKIEEIEITGMSNLEELYLDNNNLKSLYIPSNPLLKDLVIQENKIATLNIENSPLITNSANANGFIKLNNNRLSFSQLSPFSNHQQSRFIVLFPQDSLFQDSVYVLNQSINLSNEAIVNGSATTFRFYEITNTESDNLLETNNTGIFTPQSFGTFYVQMNHSDFPDVDFLTTSSYTINSTLSTASIQSAFTIYPNPASSNVSVKNKDGGVIKIFNGNGQLVLLHNSNEENTNINIDHLNSGIYFLTIISPEGNVVSQKLQIN